VIVLRTEGNILVHWKQPPCSFFVVTALIAKPHLKKNLDLHFAPKNTLYTVLGAMFSTSTFSQNLHSCYICAERTQIWFVKPSIPTVR